MWRLGELRDWVLVTSEAANVAYFHLWYNVKLEKVVASLGRRRNRKKKERENQQEKRRERGSSGLTIWRVLVGPFLKKEKKTKGKRKEKDEWISIRDM